MTPEAQEIGRIRYDRSDAVAVIEICNPARRNALTDKMRIELATALEDCVTDSDIGCILLRGQGDHFCAGAELSELEVRPPAEMQERWKLVSRIVRAISGDKPVVAAVRGAASGGGLSLAAAADYVIAADDAVFASPFMNLGLVPDFAAMRSVPARIGSSRAFELFAAARSVDAELACQWGLANEVVARHNLQARAMQLANQLASQSPLAMLSLKAGMRDGAQSLDSVLAMECRMQTSLVNTPAFKTALAKIKNRQTRNGQSNRSIPS